MSLAVLEGIPFSSIITGLGVTILFVYSLLKLLEFYGLQIEVFGVYIGFFSFILLSVFILPTEYPTI